jgi:hypothetical protein
LAIGIKIAEASAAIPADATITGAGANALTSFGIPHRAFPAVRGWQDHAQSVVFGRIRIEILGKRISAPQYLERIADTVTVFINKANTVAIIASFRVSAFSSGVSERIEIARRRVHAARRVARAVVVRSSWEVIVRVFVRASRGFQFVTNTVAIGVAVALARTIVRRCWVGATIVLIGGQKGKIARLSVSTAGDLERIAYPVAIGIHQASPVTVVSRIRIDAFHGICHSHSEIATRRILTPGHLIGVAHAISVCVLKALQFAVVTLGRKPTRTIIRIGL